MKNKNNEITALLLATLSIFILISLIQFNSTYHVSDLSEHLFSDNVPDKKWPLTGILGASMSALLKTWFLGNGSLVLCSILFKYTYLLFFKKDYQDKKYKLLGKSRKK